MLQEAGRLVMLIPVVLIGLFLVPHQPMLTVSGRWRIVDQWQMEQHCQCHVDEKWRIVVFGSGINQAFHSRVSSGKENFPWTEKAL